MPCAAGGRLVARTQGRSARSDHHCASGISPGAGGSGGTHAGAARVAAARPCLMPPSMRVPSWRCAAPPAPAPLRCLHAEDRARAPRHARMWCDALLACAFVYGGCRLLKPALCSVTVWGTPGRRRTRTKAEHGALESPPVHLSSRRAGRERDCAVDLLGVTV